MDRGMDPGMDIDAIEEKTKDKQSEIENVGGMLYRLSHTDENLEAWRDHQNGKGGRDGATPGDVEDLEAMGYGWMM